ncbi:MAG: hypothetical protein COV67_03270, partial [Nitrospinae bacterium CG11_big_fil_rev_8_21_14_0_20_56_8]
MFLLVWFPGGGLWAGPVSAQRASAPQRIVSLSPAFTEILFELGAGPRVAGITDFCIYPEAALHLPRIGGVVNPSYEKIISLKPDLIIHQDKNARILQLTRQLGIQSLPLNMIDLGQIFSSIAKIGETLRIQPEAQKLVDRMKGEIERNRERLAGVKRKSVLLLLGDSNDPKRDLFVVGRNTYINELLEFAGGENILTADMPQY